ncbi:hypothetical protein FHT76_000831 [Rhizobium sp. BK176]|nr:hypothetical protein [Rhizobium sp. BK176]
MSARLSSALSLVIGSLLFISFRNFASASFWSFEVIVFPDHCFSERMHQAEMPVKASTQSEVAFALAAGFIEFVDVCGGGRPEVGVRDIGWRPWHAEVLDHVLERFYELRVFVV